MKIDNNIIQTIKEKVEENNQSKEISSILIKWLEEIDDGKGNTDPNKAIETLISRIKL
jgi:alpha-amylase/alpha-mannosidase (GH57 family)